MAGVAMVLPPQDILRKGGGALTPFDKYVTYTPADPRWSKAQMIVNGIDPHVPALHVSTLYDPAVVETTRFFGYLQAKGTPPVASGTSGNHRLMAKECSLGLET